jgi:hypothetical protein
LSDSILQRVVCGLCLSRYREFSEVAEGKQLQIMSSSSTKASCTFFWFHSQIPVVFPRSLVSFVNNTLLAVQLISR